MDCKIYKSNKTLVADFKPVYGPKQEYKISNDNEKAWPVRFYTATTNMVDFIGNVVRADDTSCSVRGVYRGVDREIGNVRMIDDVKPGQRVMVTEHIDVNGKIELVATTKRLLKDGREDLNFINIGWSDHHKSKVIRIDVYTGESRVIETGPCHGELKV